MDDDEDDSAPTARLQPGTLARFATPMTWTRIHTELSLGRRRTWWRNAVAEAEARGLLTWERVTRTWSLTDEGRDYVRDVA